MRVLRAHLRDIYDFAFLQTAQLSATSVPSAALADTLRQQGHAIIHHGRYQVFEGGGRVAASAGMNWRSLNDCAAWRNEPVKTLALR
jgi:hypothetical protein